MRLMTYLSQFDYMTRLARAKKAKAIRSSHSAGLYMLMAAAAFLMLSFPALAKPVEMDSFKDWSVYRDDSGAERICYMSSEPKKLRGDYDRNNRGENTYLCQPFW